MRGPTTARPGATPGISRATGLHNVDARIRRRSPGQHRHCCQARVRRYVRCPHGQRSEHAHARRNLGMAVQGLARCPLSAAAAAAAVAGGVHPALRHRGEQQRLLPTAHTTDVFASWQERTPAGFVMAVKASRYLTHMKRLRDPGEPVQRLVGRAAGLGGQLGPVLLQLPSQFRADIQALNACLSCFPDSVRVAIKFRHPSWWAAKPVLRTVLERPRSVLGGSGVPAGDSAVADRVVWVRAVSRRHGKAATELRTPGVDVLGAAHRRRLARRGRRVRVLQHRCMVRG